MIRKIAVAVLFLVIILSLHFISFVMPLNNESTKHLNDQEVVTFNIEELPKLKPEVLSSIYGIEYTPKIEVEDVVVEENNDDKDMVIYLDQTAVTVKAIFRLDDEFFVVIDFEQDGESVRKKLQVGEEVLGYKLTGVDVGKLYFSSVEQMKKLQFNIFKRSNK